MRTAWRTRRRRPGVRRPARSWNGPPADASAIPVDGLPTEERITRDMLKVIAELQIEEDDQHLHQLRVVDQMQRAPAAPADG